MFKQQFNKKNPLIIIAPHLEYPTINGADISLDRLGKYFSEYVPYVDIIATSQIIRYQNKEIITITKFNNKVRNKKSAAVYTLILRTNYLKEKFNTFRYKNILNNYLNSNTSTLNILCSFFYSADFLSEHIKKNNFCMIWTHNDDYKFFRGFYKSSNLLVKLTSYISIKWLRNFIQNNKDYFLLLHVDDNDIIGYNKEHKELYNLRVNIGTDIPKCKIKNNDNNLDEILSLAFIGSLSVQMNVDALSFFSEKFYKLVKAEFGEKLVIKVIGSNPMDEVVKLCSQNNWILKANVTDVEMRDLLISTTFTILPFQYTNGAKLKMLFSLGNGIPFLATTTMENQLQNPPPYCLFSDDPIIWIDHINSLIKKSKSEQKNINEQIMSFAQQFSWEVSIKNIVTDLENNKLFNT